ncbi:glycosyltransferase family 39 protein [Candidatus Sumerlaeota bacterium]|nr:glycosyltransferase family 39 protein [Candidatus Sumerlaeota bacterium]
MSSNRFWLRGVSLEWWGLAGIVLMALSLRLWGIGYGLPFIYHSDEPRYVEGAQVLFKTHSLDPKSLPERSSSTFVYVANAVAYVPYYWVGRLCGVFHAPTDVPAPTMLEMGVGKTSMPSTFLLGRTLTLLFGVASVVLTFLIGRRLLRSPAVGLLAAAMLAVSPTDVVHSRYVTPDTFLAFFMLMAFWGAAGLSREGNLLHYVVSGIALGCAVSTKITGVLMAIPCLIAHFYRTRWRGFRGPHLYVAVAAGCIAFLATTPYVFGDVRRVVRDVLFEGRHYSGGHAGMEGDTLRWYIGYLWRVEGLAAALMIVEILRALYRRSKPILFLAVYPAGYFVFISSLVVRNDRTLLPMTPFMFLLASSLIVAVWRGLDRPRWRVWMRPALAIVVAAVLVRPLPRTVKDTVRMTALDGREKARVWIEENVPEKARIGIEAYTAFVDPDRFDVYAFPRIIAFPPIWYVQNGFDYLVFGHWTFGRFLADPKRYAAEASRYEVFFKSFPLVETFRGGGCEVRIYKVR